MADLICQSYAKTYNLKIGILRCANLYGPGDLNKNRLINGFLISVIKKYLRLGRFKLLEIICT